MLLKGNSIFVKVLLTLALPVVVVSCSFKKDPESKRPKIVVVAQQMAPEAPARTLEEIIAEDSTDEILEALPRFKEQIEDMRGSSTSILDLVIKLKRYELIGYLIVLGESPFILNEDSYRLMDYDGELDKIISSAQRDQFTNAVRAYPRPQTVHYYHYPERPSMSLFYSRLKEMPLGLRGCERFIDFVFDFTYAGDRPVFPGVYYEATFDVPGKDLVKDLIADPACRSHAANLSTNLVSKWLTKEFLLQFRNDFKDSTYLRFLTELNNAAYFDYSIPKNPNEKSVNSFLNNVVVDPALLVLVKGGCFLNEENLKKWILLAESITSRRSEVRRFSYNSNGFVSTCERGEGSSCTLGIFDTSELERVASFLFPELYTFRADIRGHQAFTLDLFAYLNKKIEKAEYNRFSKICHQQEADQ